MLHVFTWRWATKYDADDVRKLANGIARHLKQEHRFILLDPDKHGGIEQPELTRHRGCFVRLQMFSPTLHERWNIEEGERIVCIDLDVVVTGPLDPLFDRPEPFVILQGANASNPCPYNGSLWMLRAGYRPDVWTDFSIEAARKVPFFEFPDDQAWLCHKLLPDAAGWEVGARSGVYAFKKPGWPNGDDLPKDARLVVFPGWRSPDKFKRLDWVKRHWI